MLVNKSMNMVINYIKDVTDNLDFVSVTGLIDEIMNAKRIFLIGAGRSGFIARAFAMRLMHLGFSVYVIGDAITPSIKPKDLVIFVSNSGETSTISILGKIVKKMGSKIAIITADRSSTLAKTSDVIVTISGNRNTDTRLMPLGTIFEITTLVFLDSLISELMERKGVSEEDMDKRHMLSTYVGLL